MTNSDENISFSLNEVPQQYGLIIPEPRKRKEYPESKENTNYYKKQKLVIPCPGDDWKASSRKKQTNNISSSNNIEDESTGKI